MADLERNWARNLTYSAPVAHPADLPELQRLVADADRVHALGTRHSFTPCADSTRLIVALDALEPDLVVDEAARTATVGAATRLGELGAALDARGWALANLPSLPHISVAGAIATGTHGSGDALGMLGASVRALEVVGPDGALRTVSGPELAGSVVALGALGVVTRVTLAIEPTYRIRQDPYAGLAWRAVLDDLDAVLAAAYSVCLFHRWSEPTAEALVKARAGDPPERLAGAPRTPAADPAEIGADTKHTERGTWGPWWDRLPHFRLAAVPSVGEELQSEYFVPRATAVAALEALGALGADIDAALHVSEIRSVAADDHWLSPASGADVLSIGFTWRDAPDLVLPLLPRIEERLLPLGARPHWGKLFAADGAVLRALYPRWDDFLALRDEVDPDRVFGNAFLEQVLGS